MARTDSLTNFLTDIATAIKTKKGDNTNIKASDFDIEINNLSSGGSTPEVGFVVDEYDSNGYATEVTIYGMTQIPSYAFANYNTTYPNLLTKKLTSVKMPNGITKMGQYAFKGVNNLNLDKLPSELTFIDGNAFVNTSSSFGENINLTELPKNLSYIGVNAFQYCNNSNLKIMDFSNINANKTIMTNSFSYNKLESLSIINNNDTYSLTIFQLAFTQNKQLKELTLEGNIVFSGNTGSIFSNNTLLEKVTLKPISDLNLGLPANMFQNDSALNVLIIDSETVQSLSNVNALTGTPIANGTGYVYVNDSLVDTYKTATNWSTYADQIKPISELGE